MKGIVGIELFCKETGKKVYEAKNTNFISKGVRDYLYQMRMRDVFTKRRLSGGSELSYYCPDPFEVLNLTTASHREDPEGEIYRQGKVIGQAFSTNNYTGTDKTFGNYNINESFTKPEHVRMVFDFPTDRANGTFQSIYFTPSEGHLTYHSNYSVIGDKFARISVMSIKLYKGLYYVLIRDGSSQHSVNIYNENWILLRSLKCSYSYYFTDMEIISDIIYFGSTYNITLKKADLNKVLDDTLEVIDVGVPVTGGIVYVPEEDKIYLTTNKEDYRERMHVYDRLFNLIEKTPFKGYVGTLFYDKGLFLDGGGVYDSEGECYRLLSSNSSSGQIVGLEGDFIYIRSGRAGWSGEVNTKERAKIFIGSRVLLDSPVEKTSQVTMKITYDFILPPVVTSKSTT